MKQGLFDVSAVKGMISKGEYLILSGDDQLFRELPAGNWIGGTIPYFMTEDGGGFSQDKIFVNNATDVMTVANISVYDQTSVDRIFIDIPDNGFGLAIMPAQCDTHMSFAVNAPDFEKFGRPLIGWIAGVDLDQLGKVTPQVYNGQTLQAIDNGAVVMHITLPENLAPDIDIVNIFEQGDGDTIIFPEDGYAAKNAYVNGKNVNFAAYIAEQNLDLRLPLVADYSGTMINVSFQGVDKESNTVNFYAPVFKGVAYKHARPIEDYVTQFRSQLPGKGVDKNFFSCNCILNYLFSELEGKKTEGFIGPVTFGEIAYMLLNQTLVYLNIHEVS